jgi:hypothetical protein
MRVVCVPGEVDDLLVRDQGGDAVSDKDHVGVIGACAGEGG